MSTIWDRAVRALQPVLGDTADRGAGAGRPLAYYCGGPRLVCRHRACAVVSALAEAELLAYAVDVTGADPRPCAER